jgi:multidrug efflux pump subunit AcrA (membrane-fusion protein)
MKDKGELVKKNELIAVVGNDRTFYLQLNVDELDIRRVKVGQDVAVKIDAYGERVFQATVSKIYPMVNQQQQSLHVDATLKEPLADAFTGLAVEANIIIRKKDNAMVIPKAALLPGDSVLVKNDRGDEKVKVVPGIETLDEVEVMSGISAEQTLLINQ